MITIGNKHILLGSLLAVAGLSVGTSNAVAGGDVHYGSGLARHRSEAAVPVPAPVPVPETSSGYYLRVDATYAQGDITKYKTTDPFSDSVRGDSYLDNFARYGFGVGYYFNRWLRGDITFDQRTDINSRGTGQRTYNVPNATLVSTQMRDTISESFTSGNSTGMVNLYADVPVGHRFTPYVGVGLGYVRHQMKRHGYMIDTDCVDTMVNCDGGANTQSRYVSNSAGGVDYTLAMALMAGFSFKVSTDIKMDLGYRWLHLQGTTFTGRSTTNVHNVTIPDQNVHELRVGLRYDIN